MIELDEGHIYGLQELGSDGVQILSFIKRSGGAIQYKKEWPGLQTQEVIRALIERTKYLNSILPCAESETAIYHLRCALYEYEVRAYRRKREEVNRKQPQHDDDYRPKAWRERIYDDIPFSEDRIELLPIGPDGHIIPNDKGEYVPEHE